MTPRALTTVLLAVLGVYLLGDAITQVGTTVFFLTLESPQEWLQQSHRDQALATGLFVVLEVGFAVCVLLWRTRIATALFPSESEPTSTAFDLSDLQRVLFAVLGLYFAIKGLAVVISGVAQLSPHESLLDFWAQYASSAIEALFGIALFLGTRGVAGAWFRARRAGRSR